MGGGMGPNLGWDDKNFTYWLTANAGTASAILDETMQIECGVSFPAVAGSGGDIL